MACIAPSLVLTDKAAKDFGAYAEAVIAGEYLRNVGRPAFFPQPPSMDFFDISHGFGNRSLYAAFLGEKHPKLSQSMLAQMSDDGQAKIPDLVTFDAAKRTEFYEVKPKSSSGQYAGIAKIARVHALCQFFKLPYIPGVQWNPDCRIQLFDGRLLGLEVEVDFHFKKEQPGLILYDICAKGKKRPLTNAEVAAIVAAVLLGVLAIVVIGPAGVLVPALVSL